MAKIINFGIKQEQRIAHLEKMNVANLDGMDEMDRRSVIIDALRELALDSAEHFDIFSYAEKEKHARECVAMAISNVNGGDDLFSELEVHTLVKAFYLEMEAAQFWTDLREQKWRGM